MSSRTQRPSPRIERIPPSEPRRTLAEYVREGLTSRPRRLPPVLLYDARGSDLFEEICRLDAYYPTRTERALLHTHASGIAAAYSDAIEVIELGSGSSTKTEILLAELLEHCERVRYVAVDISEAALQEAALRLMQRFPQLDVELVVAEYDDALEHIAGTTSGAPALFVFLGSNLGNFEPSQARAFLRRIAAAAAGRDRLLLGLDRVKDREILLRAYDDPQGVTAAFNLNLLQRINDELEADFDLEAFEHVAVWNEGAARIEMHLESRTDQTIRIAALDLDVSFAAGERIHTESSHKFTPAGVRALAESAGWSLEHEWTDPAEWFSLNWLAPASKRP